MKKLRVLIICRWPVGGIRTYLKYNYRHFPSDEFEITLLANREIEHEFLENDMRALGITVETAKPFWGKNTLPLYCAWLLVTKRFDLMHSQGFISGYYASLVNILFRVPHILTTHGVIEREHFKGRLANLKRHLFEKAMGHLTVLHGVGEDVLTHVQEEFPSLKSSAVRSVVITNGIDTSLFHTIAPGAGQRVRQKYGLEDKAIVYGYFGRQMYEKGVEFIITAVDQLVKSRGINRPFVVLMLGRGDFIREYKADVMRRELGDYVRFEPTEPEIHDIIAGCDAVLMPSTWEAWPLLACETLCAGVPLIASSCMGLREVTKDTPAVSIPVGDPDALADAMMRIMNDPGVLAGHQQYKEKAMKRFEVKHSAGKLVELFFEVAGADK